MLGGGGHVVSVRHVVWQRHRCCGSIFHSQCIMTVAAERLLFVMLHSLLTLCLPVCACLAAAPCTLLSASCFWPELKGSGLQPLDSCGSVNSATGLRGTSSADPTDSADPAGAAAKLHDAAASDARLLDSASRLALWIMVGATLQG